MKTMKLEDIYQQAAVQMSECLRAVASVLETHKTLDMTSDDLADMVLDLQAALVLAMFHIEAMQGTQRLMDKGYRSVEVQRVNVGAVLPRFSEDKE
jgi:hypothetical protein